MKELEKESFAIIAHTGEARSAYQEAVRAAKSGDFEAAEKLLKEGEEALLAGHIVHGKILAREGTPERAVVDLLLVHAEDQLMNAETFRFMAREMVEIHQKLAGEGKL
ncbi:PTS lactose/cellobiose transporter subunit IIA [Proteiniclasticum sp. BAD-10]|jgi:PTS system cellobiose-specific IIA component|uniref:PTS lactose/cellobiose transporter subunit IIA n=1 Tax=Proteiniclasticum sediminis TaxID=2804028 RepID=A0A941HRI5_9CLOT|nr:PTS lactose/cellobiose transporter subunit IIA [Proteiniclasticum sediminis]MBR0577015.1 PTS lactose/cellobiose transporter subunit IIA [Proteiniclasticum sediminis]